MGAIASISLLVQVGGAGMASAVQPSQQVAAAVSQRIAAPIRMVPTIDAGTTRCKVASTRWVADRYMSRREHGYYVQVYRIRYSTGSFFCISMYKTVGTSYGSQINIRFSGKTYYSTGASLHVPTSLLAGDVLYLTSWRGMSPKSSLMLA